METLARLGISMRDVTAWLPDDGVRLFAEAFDGLLEAVDRRDSDRGTAGMMLPEPKRELCIEETSA